MIRRRDWLECAAVFGLLAVAAWTGAALGALRLAFS